MDRLASKIFAPAKFEKLFLLSTRRRERGHKTCPGKSAIRGRKSKPAALKQAQDNPGKRPLPQDLPARQETAVEAVVTEPIKAPPYLST